MSKRIYSCGYCQYKTKNLDELYQLEEPGTRKFYTLCETCLETLQEYESDIDEEVTESDSDSSYEDDLDSDE